MKILAVEFSTDQRSVAVIETGAENIAVLACATDTESRKGSGLGLIQQVLATAHVASHGLDCIALGLGPGSYTGMRGAIALAQGWQLATGVKLAGISTVDVIAAQLAMEGVAGDLIVAVDAQRSEFYRGAYLLRHGRATPVGPLEIVSREVLEQCEAAGARIAGPGMSKIFPRAQDLFPDATVLGRIALERREFVVGEKLEPIYLREVSFVKAPPPRAYS